MNNIELEIEKLCTERQITRWDFTNSRTAKVVAARREIAQKATYAHPEWPIAYIGWLLGLARGSARLGHGVFKFEGW